LDLQTDTNDPASIPRERILESNRCGVPQKVKIQETTKRLPIHQAGKPKKDCQLSKLERRLSEKDPHQAGAIIDHDCPNISEETPLLRLIFCLEQISERPYA
jgi:hypothetical protein